MNKNVTRSYKPRNDDFKQHSADDNTKWAVGKEVDI